MKTFGSTTKTSDAGLLQGGEPSDVVCLIFPAHHTHLALANASSTFFVRFCWLSAAPFKPVSDMNAS